MAKRRQNTTQRIAYNFSETAAMFGKHRAWTYRQVAKGRFKPVLGFGEAMIPAEQIERALGIRFEGGAQ